MADSPIQNYPDVSTSSNTKVFALNPGDEIGWVPLPFDRASQDDLDAAVTNIATNASDIDDLQVLTSALSSETLPSGGTADQVLAKASGADYDTEWVDQTDANAVDSVNGETGVVVLTSDDIDDTGEDHQFVTTDEKVQIGQNQANILEKVDRAGDSFTGPVSVLTPTLSEHAASKGYVDSATTGPPPFGGTRAAFLGDSITINQANDTPLAYWGVSFPTYATYASNGNMVRAVNAGVAGDTTAGALARFDADVGVYSPSLVVIMLGTNDWNDVHAVALVDYQSNISQIVDACRAIGATPVLCTVPPNTGSTARRQRIIAGNAWLRQFASQNGYPLVDFYELLTDPATGTYLPGYNLDGTHPNNAAVVVMGELLWEKIGPRFSTFESLLPGENADPYNLLVNGLNLTTTGSGSTLMPTGWSVQTSVHPAGVVGVLDTSDTTIKGNWWDVTATAASATNNEFQNVTGIIPGHRYAHVGRFRATGMRNADSGSGSYFLHGHVYNSTLNNPLYDFRVASSLSYDVPEGVFYQESTAPVDASTCLVRRQLLHTTSGNGTLGVAQTGLYDLTAMGLA